MRTSHTLKINFFDHTKLILSHDAQVITFINRDRVMVTESLVNALKLGDCDIISRLKYARDILNSMNKSRTGGAATTASPPTKKQ